MHTRRKTTRGAFTMVEMMVVLGVIVLAAGIALPSISALLSAGADKQSYNLISAQIRAARSLAMRNGTYAGVHIQMADADRNPDLEGVCFTSLVMLESMDTSQANFDIAPESKPERVPGNLAFGDLSNEKSQIFAGGDGEFDYKSPKSFTTMTIVFSPNGRLVRSVQGREIRLSPGSDLVTSSGARTRLWTTNRTSPDAGGTQDAEYGTAAICMFNYKQFDSANDKGNYINRNAILLPINIHTGQLFPLD
ncbi:MAG: Tfp pilus assembly protein FimT/FimU [Phycisphaerae bacterium]